MTREQGAGRNAVILLEKKSLSRGKPPGKVQRIKAQSSKEVQGSNIKEVLNFDLWGSFEL